MHISNEIKATEALTIEFEAAVSLVGHGKFHHILLTTCGGLLMAVIMETISMSYVMPAAECDLDLTLSDKGILSAVSFLGVVLSSHLWGFIGDTLGRRKLILITTYISVAMSFLSSLAPYVWLFIILRFLNGFFIGGASAVIYAYLGEFNDNYHRPQAVSFAASWMSLAAIGLPALAWGLLPMTWSFYIPLLDITFRPWRLLVMVYALPSLLFATALALLPESPKFLWVRGESNQALEILKKVYACNSGNHESTYCVKKLAEPTEEPIRLYSDEDLNKKFNPFLTIYRVFQLMWKQTVPLFQYPMLGNTIMTSILQFGAFAGSSGFLMWAPHMLNKISFFISNNPNNTVYLCETIDYYKTYNSNGTIDIIEPTCSDVVDIDVFKITLIYGGVFTLNYVSFGFIIPIVGKKLLLVTTLTITGIAGICCLFVSGYTSIAVLLCLYLCSGTCVSVINTIVVDLFPTQYRAMAVSLSLMLGRLGAMTGSHAIGYLLEYSCQAAFYIFAGELFVLVIVALLVPVPLFIWKKCSN